MAERRMFSKGLIFSDAFLDLPLAAQCLYFHLGIQADDDGFVCNVRSLQRSLGVDAASYDCLVDSGFVLDFPSGVCAITHWHLHNLVRIDRYRPTVCQEEFAQLELLPTKSYRKLPVNQWLTQDREGEERVGEDRPGEVREGFNQSKTTREGVSDGAEDAAPVAPDELLTSPTAERSCLGGELGQGVVMLSEEQMESLLSMMSLAEFDHYVAVIAKCELEGKHFTHKTHYRAILDMVRADRAFMPGRKEGKRGRNKAGLAAGP